MKSLFESLRASQFKLERVSPLADLKPKSPALAVDLGLLYASSVADMLTASLINYMLTERRTMALMSRRVANEMLLNDPNQQRYKLADYNLGRGEGPVDHQAYSKFLSRLCLQKVLKVVEYSTSFETGKKQKRFAGLIKLVHPDLRQLVVESVGSKQVLVKAEKSLLRNYRLQKQTHTEHVLELDPELDPEVEHGLVPVPDPNPEPVAEVVHTGERAGILGTEPTHTLKGSEALAEIKNLTVRLTRHNNKGQCVIPREDLRNLLQKNYGVTATKDLKEHQLNDCLTWLQDILEQSHLEDEQEAS